MARFVFSGVVLMTEAKEEEEKCFEFKQPNRLYFYIYINIISIDYI